MADLGLRERMLIKDVMSSPAITVDENTLINDVGRLMKENRIGCVIVTGKDEKPYGLITEKDLVTRVVSKDIQPSSVVARDVTTTPLITISPEKTISEAARIMSHLDIRRLGVIYKGTLVGIITSKDILAVTPELIDIIQEKAKIGGTEAEDEENQEPLVGFCDQCGRWSETLKEVDGNFICNECRIEIEPEY